MSHPPRLEFLGAVYHVTSRELPVRERLEAFHRVFSPPVKSLDLEEEEEPEEEELKEK